MSSVADDSRWREACLHDPFLRIHAAPIPRVVEIAGGLSPLSIRDQMFRAAVAVDRALEYGLIGRKHSLIVAGGSAAGVTAAIRAARQHVPTTLIEAQSHLFFRQAQCSTRYVSPTQYDWPASHAASHRYPWDSAHPEIELRWPATLSRADDLAVHWTRIFETELANRRALSPPFLDTKCLGAYSVWPDQVAVHMSPRLDLPPASLLIFATGLGRERCSFGGHAGFEFWDPDPYLNKRLGCVEAPRVLISGAGDGSLQDFIRIVTGMDSAMEFYRELPWLSESQRLKLEFAVAEIESHFQRSVVWSTKSWDCDLLTRLHDGYRSLIRSLPRGFWTRLRDAIEGRIRLGVDFQELHLHYSCRHFGRCYALNQFVVLLLSEYLRRFRGMDPLIQRSRLTKISSTNCSGGPANSCHGKTHEITLVESTTCSGVVSESARTLAAEVVVIRHGIDSDGRDIRQTVPLFMPWEQKANV